MASLRSWTERHKALIDQHQQASRDIGAAVAKVATNTVLLGIDPGPREQFQAMPADASNPQAGGKVFESFPNQLFGLFDLCFPASRMP